jgi:hypothetical protein
MSIHMLSHMYVMQSADAGANLSSSEILWYFGNSCTSVSRILEYDRSMRSLSRILEYD